jgi:hypothetical protein
MSVSLLWILNYCFREVLVVKPETSKPANSEVYLVLRGYKKNLRDIELERLFNIMTFVRGMGEDGSPAIFHQEDIPIPFVERVIEIMSILIDKQTVDINRNIELYEIHKDRSYPEILDSMKLIRKDMAKQWLERVGMKPLPSTMALRNPKKEHKGPRRF